MNGFERRKAQKQTSILEAALSLFMNNGISKVSIAEIAKTAEVSQVTIYNYFSSKENLIYHVMIFYVNKIWQEYKELLEKDLPFPEKVKKIIFDKGMVADQMNEEFFQYFMSEYTKEDNYILQFYQETALPQFFTLFDEGRNQGYIDSSISDEAILLYLQMFADYMRRSDVAESILPLTDELTKLFFYGVAGKPKR